MVTYCVGDIVAKRRAFRKKCDGDTVSLDNDDVIADVKANDETCFLIGELPFADFSIADYVRYARANLTQLALGKVAIKNLLRLAGYKGSMFRCIKRLSRVDYRKIQLASKVTDKTRIVYVNFDGLPYTKFYKRRLRALLKTWKKFDVYVSVSDVRFLPKKCARKQYFADGTVLNSETSRAVKISGAKMLKKLSLLDKNVPYAETVKYGVCVK